MGPEHNHWAGDRRGVALILVIGMLALMMVLGVTFSIFMRSERTAAGNFRADVQSRELLHVALSRALRDIETSATNAYPAWSVLQSSGSGSVNINALSGSITNHVPLSLLAGTTIAPTWIEDLPGGGRVSYVVLNCSGLLDANYAGGSNRLSGTNPREIQVSALPGPEVPDPAALAAGRPYATIQELSAQGVLNGASSNFVTFSAASAGGLEDVSGDAAALIGRQASFVTRMNTKLGLSLAEARILFTNLVDYVDADSIPGNLNGTSPAQPSSPSVEPVWMFNEVNATSTMTLAVSGADYMVSAARVIFRVESFFPFLVASKPTGCKVDLSFQFVNCSAPCLTPAVNPTTATVDIPAVASDYAEPLFFAPMLGGRINLQGGAHPTNTAMHIEVQVTATVKDSGGNIVDEVTSAPVALSWNSTVNGARTAANGHDNRECIDPRLNHLAALWRPSSAAAGNTIRALNTQATNAMYRPATADLGLDMFVANRPLNSVGELGYLFMGSALGSAWQTLRLYRHTTSPFERKTYLVWDNFTVNTNSVQKGLVNVNTRNRDVLMSVFADMPVDYPHGAGATRLQNPQLGTVVDAIMAKTAAGAITNLAELGTMGWTNLWVSGSELDIEAMLRNSTELMTTRQQYFIVLVYAQAMTPVAEKAGVVTGLRGVAEVWRDSKSPNAKFVRTLQVIDN
jgi:hypothetical protein